MIAIQFQFPTGKLHATPWGRHVNEGAVEWPPAPWRILRALLAVWRNKSPDTSENEIRSLIDALSELPSYALPSVSQGHTRHYLPTSAKPALVFDTFLVIPKTERIVICWPNAEIEQSQRVLLKSLLQGLNYFGRAESWVEADLLDEFTGELNAVPLSGSEHVCGAELERVLAVESSEQFAKWRSANLGQRLQSKLEEKQQKAIQKGKPADKIKLSAREQQAIETSIPDDILSALQAETNALRKAGWNRPPGSRFVEYVRPATEFSPRQRVSAGHQQSGQLPVIARYAVVGKVVPRLTDAIRIGERVRTFVMGCSKRVNGEKLGEWTTSPVFAGKNADGSQMVQSHSHAHYLCESIGSSSQITHLNIFAPLGFNATDQEALANFSRTWGDAGHDLQFVLLGIGQPEDFGGFAEASGKSLTMARTCVWESRTPYVPSRHLKVRNSERRNPITHQAAIQRELTLNVTLELQRRPQFAAMSEQTQIEVSAIDPGTKLGEKNVRWLEFTRERKSGNGARGTSQGYGVRLIFPEEISGPIVLGYGSHFGLGQFVARPGL